jgi:hypothetical protein
MKFPNKKSPMKKKNPKKCKQKREKYENKIHQKQKENYDG